MKRVAVVAVLAMVVAAGCVTSPAPGSDGGSTATPTSTDTPARTPTATPTSTDTPTSTPTATPGGNETDVYDVRRALDDRFDIGITFGMPRVYTEEEMLEFVSEHQHLADRIRADYGIENVSELFVKVKQFTQIAVENGSDGVYDFSIRSGNSCEIRTINGTYDANADAIEIESDTTETVPC